MYWQNTSLLEFYNAFNHSTTLVLQNCIPLYQHVMQIYVHNALFSVVFNVQISVIIPNLSICRGFHTWNNFNKILPQYKSTIGFIMKHYLCKWFTNSLVLGLCHLLMGNFTFYYNLKIFPIIGLQYPWELPK